MFFLPRSRVYCVSEHNGFTEAVSKKIPLFRFLKNLYRVGIAFYKYFYRNSTLTLPNLAFSS